MTTAIPSNLNLGLTKPTTIPAYSRRFESIATNAQTFTEGQIANIVLDTSTPGSFLDPQQSLLQFDITLTNTNPYIDYVNLSTSGMAAVIQDLRVICQGTPIEEIYDYNLMFEMFMDLGGYMQEEFKLYMENGWRAPVCPGEPDLNFVKPPMVDREGVIMHPTNLNIFGDPNYANTHWQEGNQTLDDADPVLQRYPSTKNPVNANNLQAFIPSFPDPSDGVNRSRGPSIRFGNDVNTDLFTTNFVMGIINSPTQYSGKTALRVLFKNAPAGTPPVGLNTIVAFSDMSISDSNAVPVVSEQ